LAFNPNQTFIHSQSTNSNLIADVGQVACTLVLGAVFGFACYSAGLHVGGKDKHWYKMYQKAVRDKSSGL
jgi:hypothetical protein